MDAFRNSKVLANQIISDLAKLNKPLVIIGVDGNDGVGKSHLAKELSPLLSAPIVELDKFLSKEKKEVFVSALDVGGIQHQLRMRGPVVLVEGVCLLKVANLCGFDIDLYVYVKRVQKKSGVWYDEDELYPDQDPDLAANRRRRPWDEIPRYHAEYKPDKQANYEFHRE